MTPPAARRNDRPRRNSRRPVVPLSVAVPGRARLRVDGLRGQPALKFHLEDRLAGHPTVRQVKANLVTGNLLVLFDAERVTVRDLVALIVQYRKGVPRGGNGHGEDGRVHLAPAIDHPAWHSLTHAIASTRLKTSPQTRPSSGAAEARLAQAGAHPAPAPR